MTATISRPESVATLGDTIYRQKLRSSLEPAQNGIFVAIDVNTELAYLGDTPTEALKSALAAAPKDLFHIVRVGAGAALTSSSLVKHGYMGRVFGG